MIGGEKYYMFIIEAIKYEKHSESVIDGFPYTYNGKAYFRTKHYKTIRDVNKRYNDPTGSMIHHWRVFDTLYPSMDGKGRCVRIILNN
jgi:hypothetical protein